MSDFPLEKVAEESAAQKSLGAKLRSKLKNAQVAYKEWEKVQPMTWRAEKSWAVTAERNLNVVAVTAKNSGSLPAAFILHKASVGGLAGHPLKVEVHYLGEFRVNPGEAVVIRVEISNLRDGEPWLDSFSLDLEQLLEGVGNKERPHRFKSWHWGKFEAVAENQANNAMEETHE